MCLFSVSYYQSHRGKICNMLACFISKLCSGHCLYLALTLQTPLWNSINKFSNPIPLKPVGIKLQTYFSTKLCIYDKFNTISSDKRPVLEINWIFELFGTKLKVVVMRNTVYHMQYTNGCIVFHFYFVYILSELRSSGLHWQLIPSK